MWCDPQLSCLLPVSFQNTGSLSFYPLGKGLRGSPLGSWTNSKRVAWELSSETYSSILQRIKLQWEVKKFQSRGWCPHLTRLSCVLKASSPLFSVCLFSIKRQPRLPRHIGKTCSMRGRETPKLGEDSHFQEEENLQKNSKFREKSRCSNNGPKTGYYKTGTFWEFLECGTVMSKMKSSFRSWEDTEGIHSLRKYFLITQYMGEQVPF